MKEAGGLKPDGESVVYELETVSMSDSSPSYDPPDLYALEQAAASSGFAELRKLLLDPEHNEISELRQRLDELTTAATQTENVSRVLPQAIKLRTARDQQLTQALMPTIVEALKVAIKSDPRVVVGAITPIIGPAIRKAVMEALKGMLQALNQTLESSFSWRGWRWRLEALWSGRSFAEVVLLRTLIYRVEQVFLIHRKTGLLLHHVQDSSLPALDPEIVSSMLTAVQSFVQDSFQVSAEELLDTFHVGDLTVWAEQGSLATLVAVVRGDPPYNLRTTLRDILDTIHLEQNQALETFTGDTTPFVASRTHLKACLLLQTASRPTKYSPLFWLLAIGGLAGVVAWGALQVRDTWRWSAYLEALRAEPGIVVTSATKQRGQYIVTGLRDALAAEPRQLLAAAQLPPTRVIGQWKPYQAFDPPFLLARAQQVLAPPASATLRLQDGVLYATGSATQHWLLEARLLARVLPGIRQFQTDGLMTDEASLLARITTRLDPPATVTLRLQDGVLYAAGRAPRQWILQARQFLATVPEIRQLHDTLVADDSEHLGRLQAQIEQQSLFFDYGSSQLSADQGDAVTVLLEALRTLQTQALAAGQRPHITIMGYTDHSGPDSLNKRLSQQRAEAILALLHDKGFDTRQVTAVGKGSEGVGPLETSEQRAAFNRRVSFQVTLYPVAHQ